MRSTKVFNCVVVLSILGCGGGDSLDSPEVVVALNERQVPERTYRLLSTEWEDVSLDTVLVNPAQIQVDADSWFVLDFGAATVFQFSFSGNVVGSWGTYGEGPGELAAPTDFFLSEAGEIWVLDPGNGRIEVFNRHSGSTRTVPLHVSGFRMIPSEQGALIQTMSGGHLFARVDSAGVVTREMGTVVEGQDRPGIGLSIEGRLSHDADGTIYYVASRAGFIGAFDPLGTVGFFRPTVTRRAFPSIRRARDGTIRTESPSEGPTILHHALTVSGSSVFVLARVPSTEDAPVFAVDRYDRATGSYQESFAVPFERPISIKHADGRLLLLTDTGLAQLAIPLPA